tara:strand:+ start:171 stop:1190 length:1020 start_codon:yes stop_codon:yes gene_type:complete
MLNKNNLKITNYSHIYTVLHQEFAQRNWGKKRRGDIDYLRFKHRESKIGVHENLIIALVGDRVVGQIGLIPNSLVYLDKTIEGYWLCDLMVEKEYRKLGVGIELYKYLMKKKQILFGCYPSPKSEILLRLLKFKKVKGPEILFFPIDFKALIKFKYGSSFLLQLPNLLYKILESIFNKYQKINYYDFNDLKLFAWDELYHIHLKSQSRINQPHMLHDKHFLNWRGNGLKGFTEKIRGIKSKDDSYAYFDVGSDCIYIVDFEIKSKISGRELIGMLISIAKKYKKNRLQLTSNTLTQSQLFKDLGLKKFNNSITIYHYTSNLEHNLDSLHFTLYDSDGNL